MRPEKPGKPSERQEPGTHEEGGEVVGGLWCVGVRDAAEGLGWRTAVR